MPFIIEPYDRKKAIDYAHKWAFKRNPTYYNFDTVGGDCTSFVSQCLYAGNGVMNFTNNIGWYYTNANNRAAAWSSVHYLYHFLTQNKGLGPFGRSVSLEQIEPGDIIQLSINEDRFHHSLVVIDVIGKPSNSTIYVATHYYDSDYRPLIDYAYKDIRCVHIDGIRRYV